ncbi:MAG: ParA family protein [Gammaproteobacteria bacterium]|jgi:chromosome partitioning protein|nr:ParA family protein [Gammaproteobacteria bacterium]
MAKILAVTNQKGGVGKTTTGINLAASLGRTRRRVMLIDMDPQGNATVGSGVEAGEHTVYDILMGTASLEQALVVTAADYALVPSNGELAGAQIELVDLERRESRLREALEAVREDFDFILIDCPPALNLLTINALVAADAVLIPMQCEYFAMEGLTALVDTIRRIRETLNPRLQIEGLLRTMFDSRNSLSNEVSAQLREHFGDKVYRTIIPRNVRLAEAPSYGKPVIDYDRNSKGAQAYLALAGEVLRRSEAA